MIKPEKRQQIKTMIAAGMPLKEIAAQMGVSERTVDNISKEMKGEKKAPNAGQGEAEQNPDDIDYSSVLSEKEAVFTEKIRLQMGLYEDDEEGWTFHLTAQQLKLHKSGMWWACIVYPESAPENWMDTLRTRCEMLGYQAAVSPLHDKDVWSHDSSETDIDGRHYVKGERYKTGDKKKAHYHVLFKTMQKVPFEEAADFIREITNGTYPQKVRSLRAQYEYLIHLNETDKYHYDKDEIREFGGFCIEPNETEKKIMLDEINDTVMESQITNYYDLCFLYRSCPEHEALIATRSTHFYNITKGLWQLKQPGSDKAARFREELNVKNIKISKLKKEIADLKQGEGNV